MTNDLRLAWRSLRARSGTAVLSIVVLALGIGLATAVVSIAWDVLFRPLPYTRPARQVVVWDSTKVVRA